jgi:hypothetical protein
MMPHKTITGAAKATAYHKKVIGAAKALATV